MLRTLAKTSIANGLNLTGIDKFLGARRGIDSAPLAVCYHRVVKDYAKSSNYSINAMLVSTRTFERQLDWIGQRYDFVSVDELAGFYAKGDGNISKLRNKPIAAITFDDGYADVFQNALPILSRKGIPSAVFVVTDTIGTGLLQLHDELYLRLASLLVTGNTRTGKTPQGLVRHLGFVPEREKQLSQLLERVSDSFEVTRIYIENLSQEEVARALGILRNWNELPDEVLRGLESLSWEMLQSMIRQGVTVGSHTSSHTLLAGEPVDKVMQQLSDSRRILEEKLGVPIRHFAYPDGSFDFAALKAVKEANYLSAFTTCAHSDSRYPMFSIPRRVFWENTCTDSFGKFSPAIISCQVNGIFDPARQCRRQHG